MEHRRIRLHRISLYIMALLYMAAGVNHFVHPQGYLKIMPACLPGPELLNYTSGAFEILFGILLLFRKTQRLAAWGIVLLLAAVFPANIQMAVNYQAAENPIFWLSVARLFLQPLLIWWAWIYTKKR